MIRRVYVQHLIGTTHCRDKSVLKVTIQFETEGYDQNEIISLMDRSEVRLENCKK